MDRMSRVASIVEKSIEEGFVFLAEGTGRYDEIFQAKRSEGYVVRAYYTSLAGNEEERTWVMYGREKLRRASNIQELPAIDYESLTAKELRKLCSEKKIRGYGKMKKSEMIEALSC